MPAPCPSPRTPLALAVVSAVLVALPTLAVRFPPITDLPQQVAQIRLLLEAIADPAGPLRVQWLAPYSLSHLLTGLGWLVGGPREAGRIGLVLLALAWIAAVHGLAAHRKRSAASATLASMLLFHQAYYFGLLQFQLGFAVFAGWLVLVEQALAHRAGAHAGWRILAGTLALYFTHALWLGAGLAYLAARLLTSRPAGRQLPWWIGASLPAMVLALWWYVGLEAAGFDSPTVWSSDPLSRLAPGALAKHTFGAVRGPLEPVALIALLGWLLAGWIAQRRRWRQQSDPWLLACGGGLLLLSLLLPDLAQNTLMFASRWRAPGVVLLLLGSPAPPIRELALRTVAVGLLAGFCAVTAFHWRGWEREELRGYDEVLSAIPAGSRTLQLDFAPKSDRFTTRPTMHLVAWSQVLGGGRIGFSFASFATSLVVFRDRQPPPWTPDLEWNPERMTRRDLRHFDYLLVHGAKAERAALQALPEIAPVVDGGRFALLRVTDPSVDD